MVQERKVALADPRIMPSRVMLRNTLSCIVRTRHHVNQYGKCTGVLVEVNCIRTRNICIGSHAPSARAQQRPLIREMPLKIAHSPAHNLNIHLKHQMHNRKIHNRIQRLKKLHILPIHDRRKSLLQIELESVILVVIYSIIYGFLLRRLVIVLGARDVVPDVVDAVDVEERHG